MKQVAGFILLLSYLLTSTGATLHYHYCMGTVADYSVYGERESSCGKCGMLKENTDKDGCCKDEVRWVKLQNDQKTNTFELGFTKLQFAKLHIISTDHTGSASKDHTPTKIEFPSRSSHLRTYLLHCVFRI